jgi:hypothetical protein
MAPRNKENNGGGQKKGTKGKRRSEDRGSENNREEMGTEDYRRRRDRNNQVYTLNLHLETIQVLLITYKQDIFHMGFQLSKDPFTIQVVFAFNIVIWL